jgi:monomeric sarcosine oxidase
MADAYPLWGALENEAGEELFVRCGGLYFGTQDSPNILSAERALLDNALPYEKWDAAQCRERVPGLILRADEVALFQKESGFLRATSCLLANTRLAQNYGATIYENTPVRDIISQGNQVTVTTDKVEWAFDHVIVTAGAWMGQLLAPLHLPLQVTRQQVLYLRAQSNAEYFEPQNFPVWIDAGTNYYGFPCDGRVEGVKLASHTLGETVNPDRANKMVDENYLAEAINYAARRLPDLSAEVTHSQVCLYTNTPNEDFILDHLPDAPNVWLVSGCSGHGFKFTVLLGHIAAKLATGEPYARDISRFHLKNFV